MNDTATIAAIATPAGEGGVGIIRISGIEALFIAKKVFTPRSGREVFEDRRLVYGEVRPPAGGDLIDDGFLVYMRGPHTYTGEDVVELQLHGGALVLGRALEAVFAAGARPAGPGEFTKRAFLSGRIDLTQAEAVMDVIGAATPRGLASARARLSGAIVKRVDEMAGRLTSVITRLEAGLEFPEDMAGEPVNTGATEAREIEELAARVQGLLATYGEGAALRRGVRVLILGRPNVGKSSLLNILLGEERAIVTHLPGTTRDVIEETVNIHGLPLRLMDTAGLRDTTDFVESLGVRAAKERIEGADVVLLVVDASAGDFSAEKELLAGLEDKRVILVANKVDLLGRGGPEAVKNSLCALAPAPQVFISAREGTGIGDLEAELYRSVTGRLPGQPLAAGPALIATERQFEALQRVLGGLERAGRAHGEGLPTDLVAQDLRDALEGLRELTGEVTAEDILERVFSKFCIGK
jgi:tRNA modification GTPase